MRQALEGSQAIARAVGLCRPHVIAAYPITPQTHIVENIAKLVADGELECELVSVESEFSAASVVLGAAVAGSRAYTASASQGILLMAEVLYNIAGMRIPMVLTCANRAVSAPLSIWNDHQDSMAVRDAGWIQLYCSDNQEAVDTTIQAFRIAERSELPVMVCVDGFTLTHTLEAIALPSQSDVDNFLPPFNFSRALDVENPCSLGTMLSPEYYPEARHSHHQALLNSQQEIIAADADWTTISGRASGGLIAIEKGCKQDESAEIGIITIGSIIGTLVDARLAHPELGGVRLLRLRSFRPFPTEAVKTACKGLKKLVIVERALSPGAGGIIAAEMRAALSELPDPPKIHSFAVGLGGRDVPLGIYSEILNAVQEDSTNRFKVFDAELSRLAAEDR